MKYWDSSAVVPLLLDEPFSGTVRAIMSGDIEMVSWWGTSVECCSALARVRRENGLTSEDELMLRSRLDELVDFWNEIIPSDSVRATARRLLLRHPLRAADSLQLAAAFVWSEGRPDGLEFVCLDGKLRTAAQAEGFAVVPSQSVFEAVSQES